MNRRHRLDRLQQSAQARQPFEVLICYLETTAGSERAGTTQRREGGHGPELVAYGRTRQEAETTLDAFAQDNPRAILIVNPHAN